MKRANAAAPKSPDLTRERALIRQLIELHGWSSPPVNPDAAAKASTLPVPDNIIQFPIVRKGI